MSDPPRPSRDDAWEAEEPATSTALIRFLAGLTRVSAVSVVLVGAGVLIGSETGIERLKDPLGRSQPMVPNTALMLIACGLSLWLARSAPVPHRRRRLARALAVACGVMALSTLVEELLDRDLGIDTLLFDVRPARPAVPSLLAFLLASAALVWLDVSPRRAPRPAELFAGGMATIGALALGGYVYGAIQFYISRRHPDVPGMAIHTAAATIALAIGIWAARPTSGLMAIVTSPLVGGQVVRRMLLVVLFIPLLGFIAVLAQRAGLYQPPGVAVVDSVAGMIASTVITLVVGRSLNDSDARRRRIEAESREWKRFFDRATFGAACCALDERFNRVNEAFARMHGCTVEEIVGTPIVELFAPHRRAELAESMRIADECGQCRWESEHLRKDGSAFPVVIDLSAVRDGHGRLRHHVAYIQEITEEKKAEAVRARLASLVQSADDAIVAKALDGTVLDWNRGAERLYGYTAQEMIGQSITTIVPPDRLAEWAATRARVKAGETVVAFETVRVRKDGQCIPIALTLSPIRDAVGSIVGISTIERDITLARQREREREEWSSVVAHDLRQPVAAVRLAVEVLAQEDQGPEAQKAVTRIRRASERIERMIEDLLDVSRLESCHLVVKRECVNVGTLIAEVLDLAPAIAVRCHTEIDLEASHAWADTGRFIQVMSNLLTNADKYSDPGTFIEVVVEPCGEMVKISVVNQGPGIAPDEIPKLFSRFARMRSAQSGNVPGLGLGLYICRGLVEALGGKLWVESAVGDRTRFQLTLPRAGALEEKLSA